MTQQAVFTTAKTESVFIVDGKTPCNVIKRCAEHTIVKTLDRLTLTISADNLHSRQVSDRQIYDRYSFPKYMKLFKSVPTEFKPKDTNFSALNRLHFDPKFSSNCMIMRARDVECLGYRQAICYNLFSYVFGDVMIRFEQGGVFRCRCFVTGSIPAHNEDSVAQFTRLCDKYCEVFKLNFDAFCAEVWKDIIQIGRLRDKYERFQAANQLALKMCQFAVIDEQPQQIVLIVAESGEFASFELQAYENALKSCYTRNVEIAKVTFNKTEMLVADMLREVVQDFFDEPYYDVICKFENLRTEQLRGIMIYEQNYEMIDIADFGKLQCSEKAVFEYLDVKVDGFWMTERIFAAKKGQKLVDDDYLHLVIEEIRKSGVERPFETGNHGEQYKLTDELENSKFEQAAGLLVDKATLQPQKLERARSDVRSPSYEALALIKFDTSKISTIANLKCTYSSPCHRRAFSAGKVPDTIKLELKPKKISKRMVNLENEIKELHSVLNEKTNELEERVEDDQLLGGGESIAHELDDEHNETFNSSDFAVKVAQTHFKTLFEQVERHASESINEESVIGQSENKMLAVEITRLKSLSPSIEQSNALVELPEYKLLSQQCQERIVNPNPAQFVIARPELESEATGRVWVGGATISERLNSQLNGSANEGQITEMCDSDVKITRNAIVMEQTLLEELAMESEKPDTDDKSALQRIEEQVADDDVRQETRFLFEDAETYEQNAAANEYVRLDFGQFAKEMESRLETTALSFEGQTASIAAHETCPDLCSPHFALSETDSRLSSQWHAMSEQENSKSTDEFELLSREMLRDRRNAGFQQTSVVLQSNSGINRSKEERNTTDCALEALSQSEVRVGAADQLRFDLLAQIQRKAKNVESRSQAIATFVTGTSQKPNVKVEVKESAAIENTDSKMEKQEKPEENKTSLVDSLFEDFEKRKQEKLAARREERHQNASSSKLASFVSTASPNTSHSSILASNIGTELDKRNPADFTEYLREYSAYLDNLHMGADKQVEETNQPGRSVFDIETLLSAAKKPANPPDKRENHGFWMSVQKMKQRMDSRGSRPGSMLSE